MLKRLNYKNRVVFLGGSALLLFYLIYQLAITETFNLRDKVKESELRLAMIEKAPLEIEKIKAKLAKFEESIGETMDTTYRNEPLLEFLSGICRKNQTSLADYQPPHVFNQGDFIVETKTAVIEGMFLNLISTLHEMEQNYIHGKAVSAVFQLKEDFKTGQRHLYLTVLIQSVTDHKGEQHSMHKEKE